MVPIYNASSMESPFLVEDYPYGSLRCQIRFWLEFHPKKGFRFCSQTCNPKTQRWNNPKHSTYARVAGNMFLDEKNHTQWRMLSEYSSGEEALQFVKDFPQSNFQLLLPWALMKTIINNKFANNQAHMAINGVAQPWSEEDNQRHRKEAENWKEVIHLIKGQ